MKIAILAPVPVPYERGAAERLWWGLARHFNEETRHQVEFLKLPCDESNAAAIVRAYQAFHELDLSGFDAVVSGQHAAWIASHPRHICYFHGALRVQPGGLELAAGLPTIAGHAGLTSLVGYMRRYRGAASALPEFFARWNELAAPGNAPERVFEVDGPLASGAIRWLDEIALGRGRISRYGAASDAASRNDLFPEDASVAVAPVPDGVQGWASVADALLAEAPRPSARRASRRKLLLGVTFGIHPPRHGGQSRIYHLFRALAPDFETVIVSVGASGEPPFEGEIAPGVREVRVPLSPEHAARARELSEAAGASVIDVTMPELHGLTPGLARAFEREAEGACAAITSHPWLLPAIAPLGLPIWYEAQDLELDLKRALFEGRENGARLIEAVREAEGAIARAAQVILCASPDDGAQLVSLYGADPARVLDVPNGTDAGRIAFTPGPARERLRARLGLEAAPHTALFMGSGHWPNIEAGKRVIEFATALPHVAFVMMGSASYAFDPALVPPNVLLVGEVDDITRNLCLQACDVALNPMEHGSGTNLKMLDFFAAGLPTVSTERGARGLRLEGERECLVREIADFPVAIDEVLDTAREDAQARARRARELVEREFDWDAIARRVKPRLLEAAGLAGGR